MAGGDPMSNLNDIPIVALSLPDGWELKRNELLELDPFEVPDDPEGTIWQLGFLEDLVWAINRDRSLFLDVGWFPDSDPSGAYLLTLSVLELDPTSNGFGSGREMFRFETRSLGELVSRIHEAAEATPSPRLKRPSRSPGSGGGVPADVVD
jgi:hypothetical protein